ncbi:class I SAM-dependent methyltransferase [Actinophytocola gossypii]|uniref:Class I SAM-dependent methyltransferase n=1 Tax=Actinophytocola gossypii TaxID=2812003 RepID=A0ABT2JBA3_9PSEU|nr:class I SAM-dependent methyltransferase [Actinophytocola gossypii]MCT2585125.1 class I SAM-dependent methyltransferase [Actinophytocola gossypii]
MYESEDAELYDLIHQGRGKDYATESAQVARLILAEKPDATSLLDVACGTGEHLQHLSGTFPDVAGLDLSEDMLLAAKERLPDVPLHLGDMSDFDLGREFDAVTCLFSSIGHMRTTEDLETALRRFARHTVPGGVLVVDPWWFPETFLPGYVAGDVIRAPGRTIARVSHASLEGNATRMDVHYLVAANHAGVRHLAESTLITLFTRDEYEQAFRRAGWAPTYLEEGPTARGLFVGVRD